MNEVQPLAVLSGTRSLRRRAPRTAAIFLLLLAPCAMAAAGTAGTRLRPGESLETHSGTPDEELTTPAEACAYRCTPGYRETLDYIRRITGRTPLVRLSFFGESSEGFPLPLVVAARGRRFDPRIARESGLPIVLILSGIHAGEIDGKDATLLLLREFATGESAALLDHLILLLVPIYNVDGHERIRPSNRLAQDGPVEGMGFRTTGRGLDLNRDFLKAESPETAALVGRLFRLWRPHIVLDCHVTDGMDHQYEMTYFAGEGLNAPAPLRAYVSRIKEVIGKGLRKAGHEAAPLWDLDDPADPNSGVTPWAFTPRFSTSYFQARNRVSLLAEAHAHKPFRVRVAATLRMIRSMLEEVAREPEALLSAVRESEAETIRRASSGHLFTLRSEPTGKARTIEFLGWEFNVARSEVTGRSRVLWSRVPATWRVPLFDERRPTLQIRVPRGYLLSRAYGHVAEKAHLHGLRVERTLEEAELEVEVYRILEMTRRERSYQGHFPATAKIEKGVERRVVPTGTYWIPLDQPDAAVAVWMLEPESPDGLLHWNYFDNVLDRKMVVSNRMLEEMAARELQDPEVRAAYERALAADPGMKEDPRRRLLWFYDRSPYFDPEVGLYPVFRVTGELGVPVAEWTPGGGR